MKKILSYGAGVNSTAILALAAMNKYPMPDRIIFCDTGAERPETYCYMEFIKKVAPQIETVRSSLGTVLSYSERYRIIPSRQLRWCTVKFKVEPFQEATPEEHTKILGIAYDEGHRVKDHTAEYPLVDMKITRAECVRLIQKAGWAVPLKSGCFVCPFIRKAELKEMASKHPEQFEILVTLEAQAHARNPKIYLVGDKLIPEYIADNKQETLDGFENYQHCLCKYD